jgi:4-hydroxythreonine-4-phosphate dehydrogenase
VSSSSQLHTSPPVIGITLGDSNGIGPEILIKALHEKVHEYPFLPVVYGDAALLNRVAEKLGAAVSFEAVPDYPATSLGEGSVPVLECGAKVVAYRPGTEDPDAGANAALWIEEGSRAALTGKVNALVTCPVNKDVMMQGGCPYAGHTPMLAALTNTPVCYMSLFADHMRIVHITAHLSMRDAVDAVKTERILDAIEISHLTLKQMGFQTPRIAVAGLNPHAGEMGAFGHEEAEEIAPAVARARAQSICCEGPFSPDTVFAKMAEGEFDLVVAMYHDQGHIPFKLVAMDEGVHVTLGLPFVRCSPDHGTAYDIAGRGEARHDSMYAALQLAARWAQFSTTTQEVAK